ncbi:hypothetical protein [Maridesulfovibrio sp. FT414]|uniref:hypothetical protein n=1 Tax=Maridesulfovibrio sp. FT414 TaxID=2979469 RepID=UPI003D806263
MTVVSSGNTITFAGDGVQTYFDFNFRIFREEDLCAALRSSTGEERKLARDNDFRILSGIGDDAGGRVQYPVSGAPLPAGETITLYREIAYSQELELVDNDPFSASLLNEAFDRGVMRDQQLQEQVNRALKYDISTPAEEQLSPQEFMRAVTETRNVVSTYLSGAESARDTSQAAQAAAENALSGAQTARVGAEAAQVAAEIARNEAKTIALGDLATLRSATPVLSGPAEANEGTTLNLVISDYVEDALTSYDINVAGFGTAARSGNTINWLLGNLDVDAVHSIEVIRSRRGELYSETARHTVLVKDVATQDGATMVFADTVEGYPGATIAADGIQPPAHTVGVDNVNQIVSAQMEIVQTNGELTVLTGTTSGSLVTKEKPGAVVVTDVGTSSVVGTTENNNEVETISSAGIWTGGTASFTFGSGTVTREVDLFNWTTQRRF